MGLLSLIQSLFKKKDEIVAIKNQPIVTPVVTPDPVVVDVDHDLEVEKEQVVRAPKKREPVKKVAKPATKRAIKAEKKESK